MVFELPHLLVGKSRNTNIKNMFVMINSKHTPELIAEASMAIWEYMIENRDNPQHSDMNLLWEKHGTVEMRHFAYRLSLSALEVWDILGMKMIEEYDLIPYDWEFLPKIVQCADFSELYGGDNTASTLILKLKERIHAV